MKRLLEDIRNGSFAQEWTGNPEESRRRLQELMKEIEGWEIERVGRFIRRMAGLEK